MIFKNINDFNNRILNCYFCNNQLNTKILFKVGNVTDRQKELLSINTNTNKIDGDLDLLQHIFWKYQPFFVRSCTNRKCQEERGYVCESTRLFLERKKKAIYPFKINVEAINININKEKCLLANHEDDPHTFLYFYDTPDHIEVPRINLHSFKDTSHIIDKIKTILTFS